jgi:hypothetical protein
MIRYRLGSTRPKHTEVDIVPYLPDLANRARRCFTSLVLLQEQYSWLIITQQALLCNLQIGRPEKQVRLSILSPMRGNDLQAPCSFRSFLRMLDFTKVQHVLLQPAGT